MMQLFICANSEHGYKSRYMQFGAALFHVVASDGTMYHSSGCSSPFFAFHYLIGDVPGLRRYLNSVYGRGKWRIRYFWEQDELTFKELRKRIQSKYKVRSIADVQLDHQFGRVRDNINSSMQSRPMYPNSLKKRTHPWWNGLEQFYSI